ncbi:MAG TPA: hypothetical protein VK686_00170 [Bryobacteraceae bacterium]|nr:hypothetical protein [Bryobacteraceae bacterium]
MKIFAHHALAVLALTFPVAALADVTGTVTLNANTTLSLDTGATGSTGDITWTGTAITVAGSAKDVDLASTPVGGQFSGPSGFAEVVQLGQASAASYAAAFGSFLATSSITPKVNDILVVKTNGGNYAAVLVTAIGGTISLKFDSLASGGGGGGTPSGPNITNVLNNYSYIPAGFPNSGIAPGTIFTIFGSNMANAPVGNVTLQDSTKGIPTTLAGATLSVSAGGKTFTPGMYYATPTQIAAVLPSATPTGTATITVAYNNGTSNAFQFQVVSSALGLNTYYGTGSGLVVAVNAANASIYNYTNSAKPGDTIILFGSGLGADTADSDTVFTGTPHPVSTPLQILLGGVAATVAYGGSSGYPGYDQINVVIPANAPTGCYVGLVAVTGSGSAATASNFGSLPIASGGGECSDSIFGISGSTINTLGNQTTVRSGDVFVGQLIAPKSTTDNTPQTENIAFASFTKDTGTSYATSSNSSFSLGSCSVSEVITSSTGGTGTSVGLNAGAINLTGPAGTYGLSTFATGSYEAELPAGAITSSGGAFTYNGAGGADVGSFNTTINLPNPLLNWTNQSADATVNRGQGIPITWTGGASGSYVLITGSSSNETTGASGSFTCITTQNALSFTVPGYVSSTLPAGSGRLDVENIANYGTFTATGLDIGIAFGFTGAEINSTYQ